MTRFEKGTAVAIATKTFLCPRCGTRVTKGDPVRFENYQTRGKHRYGSGRAYGGGQVASRPIHAHDCDGTDARNAQYAAMNRALDINA
jgi:uncharacterized protein YlaI